MPLVPFSWNGWLPMASFSFFRKACLSHRVFTNIFLSWVTFVFLFSQTFCCPSYRLPTYQVLVLSYIRTYVCTSTIFHDKMSLEAFIGKTCFALHRHGYRIMLFPCNRMFRLSKKVRTYCVDFLNVFLPSFSSRVAHASSTFASPLSPLVRVTPSAIWLYP